MNLDLKQELRIAGDDSGADRAFSLDAVVARGRRRRRARRAAVLGAVGVVVAGAVAGGSILPRPGAGNDADCASRIVFEGRTYTGHGELMTIPPTTGKTGWGVMPACDDGQGDSSSDKVSVKELVGVPTSAGLLADGTFYLADGASLTDQMRAWFRSPTCHHEGSVTMVGRWWGVTTQEDVRFDGDVRPPLRIDFWVETTDPVRAEYDGWRIRIRDTGAAEPALTPDDVEDALWDDAPLEVRVHCDGRDFVAEAFRVLR